MLGLLRQLFQIGGKVHAVVEHHNTKFMLSKSSICINIILKSALSYVQLIVIVAMFYSAVLLNRAVRFLCPKMGKVEFKIMLMHIKVYQRLPILKNWHPYQV